MRVLLVAGCAGIVAWIGALSPRLVYRLAVPPGAPPRDTCPDCHGLLPVDWRGWLRPSGRCPTCRAVLAADPWTYVAVSAGVFAVLGWRLPLGRPADAALAVAWLSLAAVGAVLAGIDVRVNRLPRPIIAAAACVLGPLVAVAAVSAGDPGLVVRAAGVAVVFGAVYLALALVGPGLVGLGDVYLAALVGLLLSTGPVAAILAGALLPYLLAARLVEMSAASATHLLMACTGRAGRVSVSAVIDRLSPMPLSVQLADELAAAIDAGKWNDGDKLPTESQLEREHDLTRGTVRSAINLLRKRGLAYTIQARGTFVGRPPQAQ